MRASLHRRLFLSGFAGLIVLAWLTLWAWQRSPYGRYLDHGNWSDIGIGAALCNAFPDGAVIVPLVLYVAGWVLMTAAMMLPTTLPLIEVFRRLTLERRDHRRLMGLLIAGYLVAWALFGLLAHVADWVIHRAAGQSLVIGANPWLIGAGTLALAGAFQFSSLKFRCLDRCHGPHGFVIQRWNPVHPAAAALRIGLDHGRYCVGCCWALMGLMFVVGTGNLGWMFLIGALMAAEKNLPGGQRLSRPLGAALIGAALVVAAGGINLARL